jgi:hypothetical protein
MPDRDNWSASMLMHWVLTRDREAGLSMLGDYGGSLVEGDDVTRIQPLTWEDVVRASAIDASLSADQRTREAVIRAEREIIPALDEIYGALRSGDLHSFARPNGSGDMARIGPIQWAGLRIRSLDGHDIAVPVDSEQNPLPLPRALADYWSGSVPATSTPTVWPDPLLPAEQVMQLWPQPEKSSTADQKERSGRRHADISPPEKLPNANKQRAAYRAALSAWMAPQQLPHLQRMGLAAISLEFKSHCEQHLPRMVPLLPRRLRSIEPVIERIINRRVEAGRTQNRGSKSAGNGQQSPLRTITRR